MEERKQDMGERRRDMGERQRDIGVRVRDGAWGGWGEKNITGIRRGEVE